MGMQTIEERIPNRGHRHISIRKIETHTDGKSSFHTGRELRDEEAWKLDESWTSIIGYIAELSLPGEG
jgi:hypothetical protein